MAPSRAFPLDEHSAASSSEEEEKGSSQEEEEEEEGDSSSEKEEEEQEEPAQTAKPSASLPPPATEKKCPSKKPPTSTTPQPQSSSSESDSNSDSDSDSESEAEEDQPTAAADSKAEPVASKPMEEASKKNSKAQPSATQSGSGTKRPNENSQPGSVLKRAKGTDAASSNDVLAVEDNGKKSDSRKLFQRLWSEDDEVVLLNGMHEYRVQKGTDPYKNMDSFHCFIKESLHVDVSRSQLTDKIWRLKKKYERKAAKLKDGEDPRFPKLHDKEVFELSKKIWGSEGTNRSVVEKSNGVGMIIKKCSSKMNVASPQAQLTLLPNPDGAEKMHADQNSGTIISVNQMIKYTGLNEDVIRSGYESVEASKRTELEDRWKLLELEFFAKRAELIRDQSKLILEAYRSSNH